MVSTSTITTVTYLTRITGPPGAIAIARSLLSLGKKVVFIIEEDYKAEVETLLESFSGRMAGTLPITISYNTVQPDLKKFIGQFDHLLAIERVGRASDGKYYTMSARDVSHRCQPIDDLFDLAEVLGVTTSAIGDGGNELGMGKMFSSISAMGKTQQKIACVTKATNMIAAGVSNWGGYALCAALYLLEAPKGKLHLAYDRII
eukprot:m.97990 g.97990  ORF g.97990 m.97990 type:complete len:203 (+) comp13621_c0_seq3:352-960(+)